MEPKTIVGSRPYAFLVIGVSLAGCAFLAWLIVTTPAVWFIWAPLGVGALALLAFGARRLTNPVVLQLDQDGFALSGGLRPAPRRYAWRDIAAFYVMSGGYGSAVTIRRQPEPGRRWGRQQTLPTGWSVSNRTLAATLNAYLAAAAANEALAAPGRSEA